MALPIVEKVLRKSFEVYRKPEPFHGPPPGVVLYPTDRTTGKIQGAIGANSVLEAYRKDQVIGELPTFPNTPTFPKLRGI